jgi:hypothetical protein
VGYENRRILLLWIETNQIRGWEDLDVVRNRFLVTTQSFGVSGSLFIVMVVMCDKKHHITVSFPKKSYGELGTRSCMTYVNIILEISAVTI